MYELNWGCHIANFMFVAYIYLLYYYLEIGLDSFPWPNVGHKIGRIFLQPFKPQHKFKSKGSQNFKGIKPKTCNKSKRV